MKWGVCLIYYYSSFEELDGISVLSLGGVASFGFEIDFKSLKDVGGRFI
jgi:hypothetical protein